MHKLTPVNTARLAGLVMRQDLLTFTDRCMHELSGRSIVSNWHLKLVASELTAVKEAENCRLLVNLPPRHLKSIISSVAFPAWVLGHNPAAQIICVSYGKELSDKFSRDCRQVMKSAWYRKLFPKTVIGTRRDAASDFETTAGGVRLATSIGGGLTGRGADLIIIDDPLKASDAYSETQRSAVNEWFSQTLLSRLNDKATGAVVVVMQRLHIDDLSGKLLETGVYKHICLPAIAMADETFKVRTLTGTQVVERKKGEALHQVRESIETLEALRRDVGDSIFLTQYQQSPMPAEGALIKLAWIRRYKPQDLPQRFERVFQSWDTASTVTDRSNYSVCTTWGVSSEHIFLLDVFRGRMEFPTLRAKAIELKARHGADYVLIEDKSSGTQLLQELRASRHYWARGIQPAGDKRERMEGQTILFQKHLVFLPEDATWLDGYLHELLSFPDGKHDDQVDSTSQALGDFYKREETPGFIIWAERRLAAINPEKAAELKNMSTRKP